MRDQIIKKQEQRFAVLREIYRAVDGREKVGLMLPEFIAEGSKELGMTEDECQNAVRFLISEGLCEYVGRAVGLSHSGVLEVEAAVTKPDEGTEHFEPIAINNVQHNYNIHSGGVVGAVVTGTQNTVSVAQQINAPPAELLKLLKEVRDGLDQLPAVDRMQAEEVLDALEAEAKAEKPKLALAKSYAATLSQYLLAYGPTLNVIMELIANRLKDG